jgi:UDP-N-acetylglucosamine--N-acetylmuramyl-(pentapeptide) pyrophosphoryl-undecaprenol N-acetylglucosamine transferase
MSSLIIKTVGIICFVAGRSGGHLIPCTTKAQQLLKEKYTVCLFSSGSELDKQIVEKHPDIHHICPVELENIPQKWWQFPGFLCRCCQYFCTTCLELYRMKPEKIVSFGGLVSVPVCLAGKLLGIPIELHELNVEPGRAINCTAQLTENVHIYFPETAASFPKHKIILDQYPIRFTEQNKQFDKEKLLQKFNLSPRKKTLLILGGSQGSISLNQLIKSSIESNPQVAREINIIHQTGAQDSENYTEFYRAQGISAFVCPFYSQLEDFYNLADLILCRAGAGTVFETRFFEKRAILIPHETTSTVHQISNAESMIRSYPDQFFMVREQNCTAKILAEKIQEMIQL